MYKKLPLLALVLVMTTSLTMKGQYAQTDSTYKRWFVGSTLFLLGNFAPVNSPEFFQFNVGYRLTGKDVLSLELITWKSAWPLGINPFYNDKYGEPEEKFPGYIRDFGLGIAYQRYLWKGLYVAVHLMPALQDYRNEQGNHLKYGFMVFNTNRIGYHFKLFNDKFFIQPSLGIAGRPFFSGMPEAFKQQDDKWPKWTPEPGLHFGYNF